MTDFKSLLNYCQRNDLWIHYSRHDVFGCFDNRSIRAQGYINSVKSQFPDKWKPLPHTPFIEHKSAVETNRFTMKPSNVTWFSQSSWLLKESCSSSYRSILLAVNIPRRDRRFLHVQSDKDFKRVANSNGLVEFEEIQRQGYAGVLFYRSNYKHCPYWRTSYEVESCVVWDMSQIGCVYLFQL